MSIVDLTSSSSFREAPLTATEQASAIGDSAGDQASANAVSGDPATSGPHPESPSHPSIPSLTLDEILPLQAPLAGQPSTLEPTLGSQSLQDEPQVLPPVAFRPAQLLPSGAVPLSLSRVRRRPAAPSPPAATPSPTGSPPGTPPPPSSHEVDVLPARPIRSLRRSRPLVSPSTSLFRLPHLPHRARC